MSIHASWLFIGRFGLIAVLAVAGAAAQETLQRSSSRGVGKIDNPTESISLRGVMFVGGKAYASLNFEKIRLSSWVAPSEKFLGYSVKEIAEKYVILTEPASDKEFKIYLAGSTIQSQSTPTPYTKAWINSTANPMLRRMEPLPLELYRNWSKLTNEERTEIIEYYRKHGWRIILAESIGETTNFAWENIYEAERIAVVKANVEAFQRTLTPDQMKAWTRLKSGGVVRAAGGKLTPEQERLVADSRRIKADFEASLSQSQKALFDGMYDFTKANWNN